MNALDTVEFRSKTRSGSGLREEDGVTLEFLGEFMKVFARNSVGMDLSDVNFEITSDSSQKHADSQTFRELLELILAQINSRDGGHPLHKNELAQDSFLPARGLQYRQMSK